MESSNNKIIQDALNESMTLFIHNMIQTFIWFFTQPAVIIFLIAILLIATLKKIIKK